MKTSRFMVLKIFQIRIFLVILKNQTILLLYLFTIGFDIQK